MNSQIDNYVDGRDGGQVGDWTSGWIYIMDSWKMWMGSWISGRTHGLME